MAELLRCRVRYFRDGAVLGSNEFVQEKFETFRNHLSERFNCPAKCRCPDGSFSCVSTPRQIHPANRKGPIQSPKVPAPA